ncbi:hypothetical protein LINPERPRIM_LOCUS36746 [Linum perenne]
MAQSTLPKFAVFYSKVAGKYMNYTLEGDGDFKQIAATRSDTAWNPLSKFEVVPSDVHSSMIHIRCCYNNKFLRRGNDKERYIYAVAEEKEENQDSWTCTLFTPEFMADGTVRFLHTQMETYAQCSVDTRDPLWMCIIGYSPDPNLEHNFFQVIDWESLVKLPKHLAFKADIRFYLGIVKETGDALRFQIDDESDKSIANEVVALPDGTFRVKNVSLRKFWRRNAGSFILADDQDSTSGALDSLFHAVKVDENRIALRNLENNKFCKRYTLLGRVTNSLNANDTDPTQYSQLELIEMVALRNISDIKFHTTDGWVHDKISNVVLNEGVEVKNDSETTKTIHVEIPYVDLKVSTWKATSSSFNLGPQVQIEPNEIPVVTDSSKIEMVDPFVSSYVWGKAFELKSDSVKAYVVTLEPMTKVTLKLLATSVSCDVPLTYTRYDMVNEATGQEDNETLDDGVYVGTNYINLMVEPSAPTKI